MQTPTKKTKARQCFGSPAKDRVVVPPAVSRVYGLVQKATGSVGGNGKQSASRQLGTNEILNIRVLRVRAGRDATFIALISFSLHIHV